MTTATTSSTEAAVAAFTSTPRRMLIGGTWRESASGKKFDSMDPATGLRLASLAEGSAEDVDRAVDAARKALADPAWRDMTPMDRGRMLERLACLVEDHADELSLLESRDNGKPVWMAQAVDVGTTIKVLRYFSGWPTKFEGSTIPVSPRGGLSVLNYTVHEPIGVVGAIVPWNFPMSMAAWKLAPALAMGNTVVLKPSEETSLTTIRLAELVQEAGFPDGVLNVVTGYGEIVGAAIASHRGIDKIAFTGSTEVGRQIARAATGNMKKVSLELGGKSPNIVLPDADPAVVAEGAAQAIFFNQGQVCTAGSRLYVHSAVYDDVVNAVAARARSMVVGAGTDPGTQIGPIVSARQLERITNYIDLGRHEGGEVIAGGGRPSNLDDAYRNGYFLEPTVFAEAADSTRVAKEEIFGPVLVAMRWDDVDDLVARANNSPYGLAAGIWTNDLRQAHRIAGAIRAGTVWINCYNLTDPGSPFGGYKQSGWGREMGRAVLEHYTETKSVWVNLT